MTNHTKIKIIESVFDWCVKRYGKSKYYKTYPILILSYSKSQKYHGEFYADDTDDELDIELVLYLNNLFSKRQIVLTMIHEYQHYLQSPIWLTRYYETTCYDKNPYEINAEKEAKQKCKQCIKELNLYG